MSVTYLPDVLGKQRLYGLGQGEDDFAISDEDVGFTQTASDGTGAFDVFGSLSISSDGTVFDSVTGSTNPPSSSNPVTTAAYDGLINSIVNGATKIGQLVLSFEQLNTLQQVNATRISRGLSPLSSSDLQALRPGVSVGLAGDTQKFLIYGGIALGALLLVKSFARK